MSEDYFNTVVEENLYPNKACLRYYLNTIYGGIDFKGKRFLDIGGGSGLHSFYAASQGAQKVLCLEPEVDGSSHHISNTFNRLKDVLHFDNVFLERQTLQSYDFKESYDVISLHNSINHLDETACINLLKDAGSLENYRGLMQKIASIARKDAALVVCDCSNLNFFATFKMPNPFAPTIEWNKHQKPEVWSSLLAEAGFAAPCIRWLSFNKLGTWGTAFLGNRYAAYFLHSHFCLRMTRATDELTPGSQGVL